MKRRLWLIVPRISRQPATADRQQRGRRSETLAARFLTAHGYRIAERNVRCAGAEIDLVAWEQGTLCFVEVRSTSSSRWGGPLATVTARKQHHLLRAGRAYLARLRTPPTQVRFDVVGIEWEQTPPAVSLIRGAFQDS